MADESIPGNPGDFLIYQTADGRTRVQVRIEQETVWLTQKQMAELFQKDVRTVSEHIGNIFEEVELQPDSVVRNFRITAADGKQYDTRHYNLDVIISVGYRVKSLRGTQFRIWATQRLHEYIVKGFTMDDERLKAAGGGDYFDELLERIRDIRSSERVFWRKVLDIYATSIDYDPSADTSTVFFQTVQNKMHWAIHGRTAAEVIVDRADVSRPHMGLTTWKNAPGGPIRRADVTVAKNYLGEEEIRELNRVVTMYLDFAEDQAQRKRPMHMAEWVERLDAFLQFNERNVLTHAGSVSHELAERHAHAEFEKHEVERRRLEATEPTSDFDQAVEEVKRLEAGTRGRKASAKVPANKKPPRRRKPKEGGG
jgi:hypothetical protein